ncbi:GNAT family N-acetyltransferase [Thalassovita sp.]|uniref:GNAT family N-acetyltransferase n=1 Tax=Thalassovita sp. TaxID=1979401 RepID=UPI0029DE6149|nr:GNAT family N-acetyltransferase [Thalassovita sp.]
MDRPNIYFGTAEQQALERRADLLWQIVGGDSRYACHGRAVALKVRGVDDVGLQIALARLQGVGPSDSLTPEVAEARAAAITAAGLVTDVYEHWEADVSAIAVARDLLSKRALPDGLSVHEIGGDTTEEEFAKLDALTQSCGVLLPSAAFLRGDICPAVCLYAKSPGGAFAGVAAAVAQNPKGSAEEGRVWWGMLSTAVDWRGRGIAKLLGAKALIAMAERHAVQFFDTGIRAGNVESAKLCAGLGFESSGGLDLMAIDPVTMSGGRMTK